VRISADAEKAIEQHAEITTQSGNLVAIYTDGSRIGGRVGASAASPQLHETRSVYMGPDSGATVYAAELQGILLALMIVLYHGIKQAAIFTDNQSALRATENPGSQSGQYILESIVDALAEIRSGGATVELYWLPSHRGIEGNEQADIAAKEATGWRQIRSHRERMVEVLTDATAPQPSYQRVLRSALRTQIRAAVMGEWERAWGTHSSGRESYNLTPIPTRGVLKAHKGLHRSLSTIIIQMRTGNIGLKHYLYQRKVPTITNDECRCRRGRQTTQHVLFACPLLSNLRGEIFGRRSGGPEGEANLQKVLNTPKLAIQAAKFMLRTRLLGQFEAVNREEIG
jgi:ribonuclease HI